MQHSQKTQKAINLGKQLVEQLKQKGHDDGITQWMAHYVAELITAAETLKVEDKASAEKKCFAAVIEIWKHRSVISRDVRPFAKFEPIASAFHQISPKSRSPYYHQITRRDEKKLKPDKVRQLTEFIILIDYATRYLIESAFTDAIALANDEATKTFLRNSQNDPKATDVRIVRFLSQAHTDKQGKQERLKEAAKEDLLNRIQKLEAFIGMCNLLKTQYTKKLDEFV